MAETIKNSNVSKEKNEPTNLTEQKTTYTV